MDTPHPRRANCCAPLGTVIREMERQADIQPEKVVARGALCSAGTQTSSRQPGRSPVRPPLRALFSSPGKRCQTDKY